MSNGFEQHLSTLPLIAILRGVTPDECEAVTEALYAAGFRIVEVPLNSPSALESIERLAKQFGDQMLVGAGTCLLYTSPSPRDGLLSRMPSSA